MHKVYLVGGTALVTTVGHPKLCFFFPLDLFCECRVRKRRQNLAGKVLRLIQTRLTASSFEKISPTCQA
jgi:hypothetical protein